MNWNNHSILDGSHAFLSASKYHWINYDDEKLETSFIKYKAAQRGTELHAFAERAIQLGIKLPRTSKTLNLYVNDAIGFRMSTEVCLYYSPNCFGTADTISFRNNVLRIHDLKTGVAPGSLKQLEVYAALFFLEYREDPQTIECELRLYQSDEVVVHQPRIEDLLYIINKIKEFDKRLVELKERGE